MPVLVNPKLCLDRAHCFAAGACPYGAFSHNIAAKTWEIDSTMCGDCPGPCLNFCDADALRWGDNLFEIDLLKGQIAGTISAEEAAERRVAHAAEEQAAQEAAEVPAPALVAITQANLQAEVLLADLPVFMDCWADWCGPCKIFAPTFEVFAERYAGVVKCVKLDTEGEPALAQALGIRALPTLILFYKGQIVDGAQGALSPQQLESWATQRLDLLRRMYGLPAAPAPAAADGGKNGAVADKPPAPAAGRPTTPAARPVPPAAGTGAQAANKGQAQKPPPKLYLP